MEQVSPYQAEIKEVFIRKYNLAWNILMFVQNCPEVYFLLEIHIAK